MPRSDKPVSRTTPVSGPGRAHAFRSPARVENSDSTTTDTYGPSGSNSSASAALTSSLRSRLEVRLASSGSILFRHSWKEKATPLRRSICRLAASARRISDNDCTSWPSPVANDAKGSDYTYANGDHNRVCLKLGGGGKTCSLPTRMGDTGKPRSRRDTGAILDAQAQSPSERVLPGHLADESVTAGTASALADSECDGRRAGRLLETHGRASFEPDRYGDASGTFWSDCDWVYCSDGKHRPVEHFEPHEAGPAESGTKSLADGLPGWLERVCASGPTVRWNEIQGEKPSRNGMLKAFGNGIVVPLAATFIASVLDVLEGE